MWLPHYLPAWSSRGETAATYAIRDSCLHLTIPPARGFGAATTISLSPYGIQRRLRFAITRTRCSWRPHAAADRPAGVTTSQRPPNSWMLWHFTSFLASWA